MELSVLIFKDLVSKFIVAAVGYAAIRFGILKSGDNKIIANMLIYFFAPCALFGTFSAEFDKSLLFGFAATAVMTIAVLLLFSIIGKLLHLTVKADETFQASLIFSNNGSFTISLVDTLMGSEALLYLGAYIIVHVVYFWTYGFKLLSGQPKIKIRNLLNPNIIAAILGLTVFLARIHLPDIVSEAISSMGSMNSPLVMFMIGMSLANCDLKKVLRQRKVWILSLARMIAMPLIIVLILAFSGIGSLIPELYMPILIVIIAASGPLANNVLEVTLLNPKTDEAKIGVTTSVCTLTTLMCIVTIPVMIMLYQALC